VSFTQKLFTSFHSYPDGDTRIGELNRIWYDSNTNTLRIQLDNVTPGGTIIGMGDAGGYILAPASINVLGGVKIGDNLTITDGGVLNASAGNTDGGTPQSVYGGINAIDGGGIDTIDGGGI
jgi:hypothetical protein